MFFKVFQSFFKGFKELLSKAARAELVSKPRARARLGPLGSELELELGDLGSELVLGAFFQAELELELEICDLMDRELLHPFPGPSSGL